MAVSDYDLNSLYVTIWGYSRKHGYSPTLDELAAVFSVSRSTMYYRLNLLAENGSLEWESRRKRAIRLLEKVQ